jgi:hypothetical protein
MLIDTTLASKCIRFTSEVYLPDPQNTRTSLQESQVLPGWACSAFPRDPRSKHEVSADQRACRKFSNSTKHPKVRALARIELRIRRAALATRCLLLIRTKREDVI